LTVPAVEYVAAAGQRDFDVPFPYINRRHVEVLVNGTLVPVLEWVNDTRLRIDTPVAGGEYVVVQRTTPIDQQLVKFQDGAILTQEDLNLAVQQLLYKQQEIDALYGRLISRFYGKPETDPQAVVEEIANLVLEQEVLNNFRQRIADIDLSAEQLAQQALQITEQGEKLVEQATSTEGIRNELLGLANDLTALQGVVDGLANLEDGTGLATVIQQEQDARIAGDTALAALVSLIGAKSGTSNAFLLDLNSVRVGPTESLAQRLSTIKAGIDGAVAAIQTEAKARADADSAEVTARETLGATVAQQGAAIETERKARIDGDAAEASARNTLAATLRGETDSKISAAITAEQQARADAISAEATARTNLAATLRNETDTKITAAIQTEQRARADAISAEATARTTLASTLRGEIAASVQSEATTRASADSVFTNLFTLLGAKNTSGTAFVLNDNTVQLSNGVALGTRLSGIDTKLNANAAAIVDEQTARANADGALSQSIQVVNSQVGNLQASVATLSQSIDGVKARYGVSLDVNGYVTGFVQNNDGRSGSFVVLANRFAIVDPNGGKPTVPFEVSNGNVFVNGQRITPGSISADRLSVTSLSALTADIGFLVSYNGHGGRVERDGNGTRIYGNNGVLRVKVGF